MNVSLFRSSYTTCRSAVCHEQPLHWAAADMISSRQGEHPHIGVILPLVIITSFLPLQPPFDADNSQSVAAYIISSSSKLSGTSAGKESRTARREGMTRRPAPIVLASYMQLHPVTHSPPCRNVQGTGSIISETKERNEFPHPYANS